MTISLDLSTFAALGMLVLSAPVLVVAVLSKATLVGFGATTAMAVALTMLMSEDQSKLGRALGFDAKSATQER